MDFNSIPSKINTETAITPATQSAGSGNWQNPNLPLNRERVYITAVLSGYAQGETEVVSGAAFGNSIPAAVAGFTAGELGVIAPTYPIAFASPLSCTGVHGATIGTIAYYIQ